MRNSKSTYMFTYYAIFYLVSISILNAVYIPSSLRNNPDKQTHKHKDRV